MGGRPKFLATSPLDPIMTSIAIAIYGGLLLAIPVASYQLYAFLIPAVSARAPSQPAAAGGDGARAVHRRRGLRLVPGRPAVARLPAQLQLRLVHDRCCARRTTSSSSA